MKKPLTHAFVLLCITLYSCHKDNTTTPAPASYLNIPNQDIALHLTYTDNNDTLKKDQWEVIISEPAGKVLLDTVAPVNTALMASLHTNAYAVNVTSVFYSATWNTYQVTTYKGVNPRNWTALPNAYAGFPPVETLPQTVTTSYYIHPPYLNNFESTDFNDIIVSDYTLSLGLANPVNYQPSDPAYQPGGLLTVANFHHGNNPVYTLFPQLGLYNFHTMPATGNDTVDLTHMDTAVMVNYPVPSSYSIFYSGLLGYTDTTDLSRSMTLFTNDAYSGSQYPATLEYPPTGVQTYTFDLEATSTTTNEYIQYLSYGTKIASSINWVTAADYTLQANLQDSFAVSFNGVKPAFYNMTWQSGRIGFEIYSAPDGVALHPYTWFTHLGSKLLQGQSIPSLAPSSLYFARSVGLPSDYDGYLSAYATPAIPITPPVGTAVTAYSRSW
jgi:hypothetical protein